jgi:hypothetical protein
LTQKNLFGLFSWGARLFAWMEIWSFSIIKSGQEILPLAKAHVNPGGFRGKPSDYESPALTAELQAQNYFVSLKTISALENYCARARVKGKLIWKPLKIDDAAAAKLCLGDFQKGEN